MNFNNNNRLAIFGGKPVRKCMLQYGKQTIDHRDIEAISEVLKENKFLTTGPYVSRFEENMANFVGCKYAIAVSNATAGLHCAVAACNIGPGDEVIVPAISFVASSNCILYVGAKPVFVDIEENTLNIDASKIEAVITDKTRAIIMVDLTGQPADYHAIRKICVKYNLILIQDAAHSVGTDILIESNNLYDNEYCFFRKVGYYSDLTVFSFHPVKNMTTGEGGMVLTNNSELADKIRKMRSHGISIDYKEREKKGNHYYDMDSLGFNYRMTDIQAALGISQLKRLPQWIKIRREIAEQYHKGFEKLFKYLEPFPYQDIIYPSGYHIYVIRLKLENLTCDRDQIFKALRSEMIGVNVHYMPIYLHSYYQKIGKQNNWNYNKGICPIAEQRYNEIITLPLFPTMIGDDILDVIDAVTKVVKFYSKYD